MIRAEVIVKNKSWKDYLKKPETYFRKRLSLIDKKFSNFSKKKFYFTIMLAGNVEIKRLNKFFRDKNKSTDVLSFPHYQIKEQKKLIKKKTKIYLGDIIINYYKIKKNKKKNFYNQLDKTWIHGFLHLLGYIHKKDIDYEKMNKYEKKYFKEIQKLNDKKNF
tara:strand:+ start:395 stop:880 length:486 start_codon:yes stop_codon:yes gene_type:complete